MLHRLHALALALILAVGPIAPSHALQSPLFSPNTGTVSGLALTNNFNGALDSLNTSNSGNSAPANQLSGSPSLGNTWLNTTAAPYPWNIHDGNGSYLPRGYVDPSNHIFIPITGGGTATVSSAATTDIGALPQTLVTISGTITITSLGSSAPQAGIRKTIVFSGALLLTHNATVLILPGAANIATNAGDMADAIYLGGGNWRVVTFTRGTAPTAASIMPQGRLTLLTANPVMATSQANKSTLFYDCHIGKMVPYFDGTTDTYDTISSCEVSTAMVAAVSAGQVVSGQVYDVWWVHSGANRICLAMSTGSGGGGGWASDTGGSSTARGSGYSAVDRTRGYLTNTNSITNCFNGATNYGTVAAHQGTYLGTIFATANGQTSYVLGSPAAGGGQALLYVWNAYNRVPVRTRVTDNNVSWTYALAPYHNTDASATNRISWVSGLAEDGTSFSYFQQTASTALNAIGAIGIGFDGSGATPPICIADQTAPDVNGLPRTASLECSFDPVLGSHFVQAQESTDGSSTYAFGGLQGGVLREGLNGSLMQ